MSHFTVLVAADDYETALAPFDEELEVPRYISATREQLIAGEREHLVGIRDGNWARYVADPAAYAAACHNPAHLAYFAGGRFEAELATLDDDDALHAAAYRSIEPEDRDEHGNEWSSYNPKSKWDWYVVGGRWEGNLRTRDGGSVNTCLRSDLAVEGTAPTFAVLVGEVWHQRGRMGWWGAVSEAKADDAWRTEWLRIVSAIPGETKLTLVDAHI